jgi:chromosome segregation ATPase
MEQHAALGIKPWDQDSVVDSIAALKNELADEKQAQEKAQVDVETLFLAVEELKKTMDQLTTYVPSLNNKIVDLNAELCARELSLERTTAAKDKFQRQSTWLTKKLEGISSSAYSLSLVSIFY